MKKNTQRKLALTLACAMVLSSSALAAEHVVVSGDNLSTIADQYGTTWQAIDAVNNLADPNLIYPGDVLQLPDTVEVEIEEVEVEIEVVPEVVVPEVVEPEVVEPEVVEPEVVEPEVEEHEMIMPEEPETTNDTIFTVEADGVGYLDMTFYQVLSQGVLDIDSYNAITEIYFALLEEGGGEYTLGNGPQELKDLAVDMALEQGLIASGMHGDAETNAEICKAMTRMAGTALTSEEANAIEDAYLAEVDYTAAVGGYYINGTDISVYITDTGAGTYDPTEAYGYAEGYVQDAADYVQYDSGSEINYVIGGTEEQWTIIDLNTGLEWQAVPGEKVNWLDGMEGVDAFNEDAYAGYSDWRVPTIKEVYSLSEFTGAMNMADLLNGDWFIPADFDIGANEFQNLGDRDMDRQVMTSTIYAGTTVGSQSTVFGYNGVDGYLKGYPTTKTFYLYHVRNTEADTAVTYGVNMFVSQEGETESDATVQDLATYREWTKYDSLWYAENDASAAAWLVENTQAGTGEMDYYESLAFASWANEVELGGYSDWYLPTTKELQSILDFDQSLQTTGYAAINPDFFQASSIETFGFENYGYYVSSTPFFFGGKWTFAYVAFGPALGSFGGIVYDVHGAGGQRSETLTGDYADYPYLLSTDPQGDDHRTFSMVRLVREMAEDEIG